MNYILFDDSRENLLPLTFTRPVCDIRVGILTIREKWEKYLKAKTSTITETYLSAKYPLVSAKKNILINGSVCPNKNLLKEILALKPETALMSEETIIAVNTSNPLADWRGLRVRRETKAFSLYIKNLWDIFQKNGKAIEDDFHLLTAGKKSQKISKTNQVINEKNIFLEQGAKVECSILNAGTGPIYIGKDAEIMEGCLVRGPFSLGEHSQLKMGAKIYGPTTIGHESKVGGEVNNSVIFGFSNKAHDGFLGNSVVGEWCNIGADSNNSNLKNNYAHVRLWNYHQEKFEMTGLTFCGLIMGDHSKCGINTMFNTGTVVGVSANVFGTGFPRNFIPDFSWGGANGFSTYNPKDAFATAKLVYERRNKKFDDTEKNILNEVFMMTEKLRGQK
ncbi:MAG: GlmU family protein [Bacteroidetes bacterium]|nr:GlmU family protein [Bacteroidota bacterium]